MAQCPQAIPRDTILYPDGTGWKRTMKTFDPHNISDLPMRCYIFLHKNAYPSEYGDREVLLKEFNVPIFVANRACTELNGYFGCRATYNVQNKVKTCSTWFRCLVKMVHKVKEKPHEKEVEYVIDGEDIEKGYTWFEMGVFTRWDEKRCQVLCVDTPFDLPEKLKAALEKHPSLPDFRDPFAMHTELLDQIIMYYEISVWRVRDPVRRLEKARLHLRENVFKPMHEISRHAIHTSEILTAMIGTMKELQRYQADIHENLFSSLEKNYTEQAKAYTNFQIQLVKSLKLRSESNQERLKNEVNLAFNNLALQDNTVIKSIALLTMVFLPATFFSALFSTTFFTFGENGWKASHRFWIYWVITVPVTIVVVATWNIWLAYSRLRNVWRTRSWDAIRP